jgi:hypothetical protein
MSKNSVQVKLFMVKRHDLEKYKMLKFVNVFNNNYSLMKINWNVTCLEPSST